MLYHKNFYKLSFSIFLIIHVSLSAMNKGEEKIFLPKYHNGDIRAVAYSPNGQFIASGGHDKKINILNIKNKNIELYCTLSDHSKCEFVNGSRSRGRGRVHHNCKLGYITTLAFSPTGKQIAASDNKKIRIWDVASRKTMKILPGHNGTVHCISYSPNGKNIASVGFENSQGYIVKIWDVRTGNCIKKIGLNKGITYSVIYSPNGQLLANSNDRKIALWDVNTGKCIKVLCEHNLAISSLDFSPNGKNIASGSQDGTVKIWDVKTGDCLKTLKGHTSCKYYDSAVFSISYSPNGKNIASGSMDRTIKIWDVNTGECIKTLVGNSKIIHSISFSPDGRSIVSGASNNLITIWKNVIVPQLVIDDEEEGEEDYEKEKQEEKEEENDYEYGICGDKSKDLAKKQQLFTSCCKKFICKKDSDEMEKRAKKLYLNLQNPEWRKKYSKTDNFTHWPEELEHAKSPFCRHYPLKLTTKQICSICLDDKTDFTKLYCKHNYCTNCLKQMIELAIREKTTTNLRCPTSKCNYKFDYEDICKIVKNNKQKVELINNIKTQEWLIEQPNVKHCPTPDCKFFFIAHKNYPEIVFCPQCKDTYCSKCLYKHNIKISCKKAEENRLLLEKKNKEEKLNYEWIKINSKPCPKCGAAIQKNGGCDFVKCLKCNHGFCYNCYGMHHVGRCYFPSKIL